VTIKDSQAAIATGIGMVHQHFMLVDNFTVLENVMLGAEGGDAARPAFPSARAELKRLEKEYGLEVNPDALIEQLPVGLQQRVEILKALYRGADILILDEPTGVLTPPRPITCSASSPAAARPGQDRHPHHPQAARDHGDHRYGLGHAPRRDGGDAQDVGTTVEELAELMVGRRVLLRVEKGEANPGKVMLSVEEPDGQGRSRRTMVDNVSFDVRAGEIVGIAGVAGNGQSELLERLPASASRIPARSCSTASRSTRRARRRTCASSGLAHVPEDRHHMGLVLKFEEYENSILGYHRRSAYSKGPLPRPRRDPQGRRWRRSRNTTSGRRTRG
jgi:ABC-type uncharacterized transport system ATPase subunit